MCLRNMAHVDICVCVSVYPGRPQRTSVFAYPPSILGGSSHVALLNSNQVPLSRGTPAAGRNKHNEFFRIVAEL